MVITFPRTLPCCWDVISSPHVTYLLEWEFCRYEYQRIPMGLCNSPDIFQEKMSELMEGIESALTYLDDLLCITKGSFEDHLEHLDRILARLKGAGLKVNANKSAFCQEELEYLGYWIS